MVTGERLEIERLTSRSEEGRWKSTHRGNSLAAYPTSSPVLEQRWAGRLTHRLSQIERHEFVNHTQKEYARGDVHENRAECLFSLLKPYLRVFRGVSKTNLPGYVGFFQCLRNFRQYNAFEQAELISLNLSAFVDG